MTDVSLPGAQVTEANLALKRILTAAWLAVIAGVLVQMIVVGVRAWAGGVIEQIGFAAEMAQAVTWSALVCAAIAVGTLASKSRQQFAGLIGLFAGPLAWAAAKGVQKGVQALAGAPQDQLTPLFWSVCAWKGIEYAVLGFGLAAIVGRAEARLGSYITFGALLGLLSACIVIALNLANATLAGGSVPGPKIASLFANELFFATACSMVIYTAQALTRNLAILKT
ncbi:hypothetical protein [Terricaulis silvestris]|nr:hypothetical protein [Terricaulis silvestris]